MLIKETRDAQRLTEEGAHLFYIGRYGEALAHFEKAGAIDPTFVRAQTGRAISLAQLGRADEGLAIAQDALRLDPTFANTYCVIGLCLNRLGKTAEAQAAYEAALARAPDDARVLYNMACFWAERGDEEKCRAFLARTFQHIEYEAIAHARDDPDLARYVGRAWFRELLAAAKQAKLAKKAPGNDPRPST